MARGHFYPLPPPFIGGRQPYAPALGQPQSGLNTTPPPRTLAVMGVIISSWARPVQYQPPLADIAPFIPAATSSQPPALTRTNLDIIYRAWKPSRSPPSLGALEVAAAPDAPPPLDRRWLGSIVDAYRDRQWTLIYTASIAPILAVPATADNPPPNSYANLSLVVTLWRTPPPRPPALRGVGQFTVPVVPDAPPPTTYARLASIRTQWEPKPWWPLPAVLTGGAIPSIPAVVPDAPPKSSYANLNLIAKQWEPRKWWPLPSLIGTGQQSVVTPPDNPPQMSYANLNRIVSTWNVPPWWPPATAAHGTQSGPVVVVNYRTPHWRVCTVMKPRRPR